MDETIETILEKKNFKSLGECMEFLYMAGYPYKDAEELAKERMGDILSFDLTKYEKDTDEYKLLNRLNGLEVTFYNNPNNLYYVDPNELVTTSIMIHSLEDGKLFPKTTLFETVSTQTDILNLFKRTLGLNLSEVRYF